MSQALQAAIDAMRVTNASAPESERLDAYDLALCEEMLRGYDVRWADQPWEVVSVEQEYRTALVNPETGAASKTWQRAGKIDALVRNRRTGLLYLCEHKTSSEDIGPGSDYWMALTLDPQVSGYYDGARELGYDVVGCLYDVLGKPKLTPKQIPVVEDGCKVVLDAAGQRVRTKDGKKWRETADAAEGHRLVTRTETVEEYAARVRSAIAEDPDRYYQRGEVVRLEREEWAYRADAWATGKAIRQAQVTGLWIRNPDACKRWGRRCEFFGLCTGTEDASDTTKWTRREWKHPELTAPTVPEQVEGED